MDLGRRIPAQGLTRRDLLRSGAAGAAAAALAGVTGLACGREAAAGGTAPAGAPNILFVFSDSHRACSMGCYGNPYIATPSFDAFAGQGLRLATAMSSTPLCRPFRASFMSGCFSHHTGLLTNNKYERNFGVGPGAQWEPARLGLPELGAHFRAAGYRCSYLGKWHLGEVDLDPGPLRFGFDDDWTVDARNAPGDDEEGAHDYWSWTYFTGKGKSFSGGGFFRTTMETDLLLEYLKARVEDARSKRDTRPWLMVASWGPPHEPFTPPEEYEHYADVPLPANVRDDQSKQIAREVLPLYYALIEAIDHEFGRLVAGLDALGLERDTLVVYTSDHGNQYGSQDALGKEQPYSESSQIPFLLRWTGRIAPGGVLDMPFGTTDILPTLSGLAGLPAPAGVDGRDLSGALLGRAGAPRRDAALLQVCHSRITPWPGWRAVRTPQWLFARMKSQGWLLFDLANDPLGLTNLVGQGRPEQKELQGVLTELMTSAGDDWGQG